MNILPKKKWHVRTKENIARVRKDEAEAAEKERQEKTRIEHADREARLSILKLKSKQKLQETIESIQKEEAPTEHINFFSDLEHAVKTTNKEHDIEVKEKKEEYEKKIGYLTYLGQDTNEALGKKNWYEVPPSASRSSDIKDTYDKLVLKDKDGKPKQKELDIKNGEVSYKSKQRLDPINAFKLFCHTKTDIKVPSKANSQRKYEGHTTSYKQKNKILKKSKEVKKEKVLLLREARLKREKEEKTRTEQFLKKLHGELEPTASENTKTIKLKPKYNSQFNPELARQNYR